MASFGKTYQRETASDHVYRQLRHAILSKTLAEGERLIETTLADQLGVSRTPVREALSRLQADGLIGTSGEANGVVVLNTSDNTLEIIVLRRSLEACAAFLAATRVTKAQLLRLKEIQDEARRLPRDAPSSRLLEIDREFHQTLGQASGSQRIHRLVAHQYSAYLEVRPDAAIDDGHLDLHDRIVAALARGDAEAAESYARKCANEQA